MIFYLANFRDRNWCIPGFYENNSQHWALFSTKTNQGWFYFQWPNSLSRAKDIAAVNHVTQAVIRVGSRLCLKVGFKELRLEPKFLNRGLWGHVNSITKFGFDRFSCLDIYWIQTDTANRQADKQSIYLDKYVFRPLLCTHF